MNVMLNNVKIETETTFSYRKDIYQSTPQEILKLLDAQINDLKTFYSIKCRKIN